MKTNIELINELNSHIKSNHPKLSVFADYDNSGMDAFYSKPNKPYIMLYPNGPICKSNPNLLLAIFAHEYGHYLSFKSKSKYDKKTFRISYTNYLAHKASFEDIATVLYEETIAWIYGFNAILNLRGSPSFSMIFLCFRCLYGYYNHILGLLIVRYIVQYYLILIAIFSIFLYHIFK